MASAVIQTRSAEQVADIVKAANEFKMPVSPISIGRNLGYGGAAPPMRGTAVIDMRKMDRILEVNEDSAFCLVEPGVSYFNMYEHLRKIGSNLWIDCPDIGWGSMIGNMTERGAGYTPRTFLASRPKSTCYLLTITLFNRWRSLHDVRSIPGHPD